MKKRSLKNGLKRLAAAAMAAVLTISAVLVALPDMSIGALADEIIDNMPPYFINPEKIKLVVDENLPNARAGTIKAEDDEGDHFTFEITGGNAQDLFDINPSTGVVKMKDGVDPFDYEEWVSNNKPEYKIHVEVLDARAARYTPLLGNEADFTIAISDVNERPYFDYSATDPKEVSIAENATFAGEKVKTADLDIYAEDAAFTNNEVVAVGGAIDVFGVTSEGLIYVKEGKALDYETEDTYTLNLRVQDANKDDGGDLIYPDLQDDITITINVTDVVESSTVTTLPVAADGWTYDGGEHALLASSGVASYGAIKYAVKTDDSVPADSDYKLAGLTAARGASIGQSDSFFLDINGEELGTWDINPTRNLAWSEVKGRGEAVPRKFTLKGQAKVVVRLRKREWGAALAKMALVPYDVEIGATPEVASKNTVVFTIADAEQDKEKPFEVRRFGAGEASDATATLFIVGTPEGHNSHDWYETSHNGSHQRFIHTVKDVENPHFLMVVVPRRDNSQPLPTVEKLAEKSLQIRWSDGHQNTITFDHLAMPTVQNEVP